MPNGTLGAALEREHREIDAGLEAFAQGLAGGESRVEPLMAAIAALKRHIYIEEELVFPSLRKGGMMAPVFVMLREHGEIWRALDALEADLSAGAATAAMAQVCQQLAGQLEAHNLKEEAILYPRTDDALTASEGGKVGAFLATGLLPEGWVCSGARS